MNKNPSSRQLRTRAYNNVHKALRRNLIQRPSKCARCKTSPGFTAKGRALLQAHHPDYTKPLQIEWLCPKCHRTEMPTAQAFIDAVVQGEQHGMSKLTAAQVRKIRSSMLKNSELSNIYGVSAKAIQRVRNNNSWRHIKTNQDQQFQDRRRLQAQISRASIAEADVLAIRAMQAKGLTHKTIGDHFHLSRKHISRILGRHYWGHVK